MKASGVGLRSFLMLCRRIVPVRVASLVPLRAAALDLALLASRLLVYPAGIVQERQRPSGLLGIPVGDGLARALALRGRPMGSLTEAKPPVVLLHGFIDNRSALALLRHHLVRQGGLQVVSLNYSPLTCDIRAAAAELGRRIEEVCERTGSQQVDVVGHSLGGLIARYYAQRLGGDARVRTLVTLGTPHSGTRVAPLADVHPIVRQMRPGSSILKELSRPAPGCRTHFYAFWSDLDRAMDPLETARIEHPDLAVKNVQVSGVGHLSLLVHPAVATGIRLALDTPNSQLLTLRADASPVDRGVLIHRRTSGNGRAGRRRKSVSTSVKKASAPSSMSISIQELEALGLRD